MVDVLVALDVAILVPAAIATPARALSRVPAGGRPDALRLDDRHLPHVTLAQQFVERARLDELFAQLDRILRHEPAVPLHVTGAVLNHRTAWLAIDCTPDLQRLHELVMKAIEAFASPEGDATAFHADDEEVRRQDVDWVQNYREEAAYAHYHPHVTIGHGDRAPEVAPIDAVGDRVAGCELGRFCTCRAVLREWHLGGRTGL